jgi:hypothetical protein
VVGRNEETGPAITTPSVGGGPFGFDFDLKPRAART